MSGVWSRSLTPSPMSGLARQSWTGIVSSGIVGSLLVSCVLPSSSKVWKTSITCRMKQPIARTVAATTPLSHRIDTPGCPTTRSPTTAPPNAYDDLVAAGDETQRAQRRALSGVRDNSLRDAAAVRRARVDRLTDAAADILIAAGARPASHLDDVATTFEAASADPTVAGQVGVAQLSAPIRLVADFSGAGALASVPGTNRRDDPDDDPGDGAEDARAAQRRAAMRALEEANATARTAAAEAQRTRAEAQDADRHAEDARAHATAARAAAADADADSADADAAAELARASAKEAASLAQTMADVVDTATRELADLAER